MNIEFRNVSFSYPDTTAGTLQNISFSIKKGEFILLAGESGCGKTTVTRIINGLIPSFYGGEITGEVLLDGKNISDYKSYELSDMVGSVFQNPKTQFFNVDTDSEITFGLENAGEDRQIINDTLEKVTSEFNISNLRNRDIFKLSGGEKQKIAFASAYATDPEIFLLDEPSANLDTAGIIGLKECFADFVINECTFGVKKAAELKVKEILGEMGLLYYKDRHPNTLSGGQKQRLAIAVSLMMDKDILLFDEPTSGLDYRNMLLCSGFLKNLAAKGKIIIVVTHDEEFMNCCCESEYQL